MITKPRGGGLIYLRTAINAKCTGCDADRFMYFSISNISISLVKYRRSHRYAIMSMKPQHQAAY